MGYLRDRLRTRRGRRIALGIGAVVLVWLIVRCSSDAFKPPALVYLPAGTISEQITALHAQEIPLDAEEARTALGDRPLPSGWVRFNPHLTLEPDAFFKRLRDPAREPTRRVVMYSGDTIQLFAKKLASQTLLSEGKLLNAYYRYSPYSDGGILAGHYDVPYRTTPMATMFYLTYLSKRRFRKLCDHHMIPYDPATFKRTLILASIIQKETWHTEEMPRIASVITNRLKRGMKLQLDATLNYGPYAHTPVTPERIRTDASRYNTYRYAGLPPEPISSVTEAALNAAFNPAHTSYLFFVRNTKGTHDFATTYTRHVANIQRIKKEKEIRKHPKENTTIPPVKRKPSPSPTWDSSHIPYGT